MRLDGEKRYVSMLLIQWEIRKCHKLVSKTLATKMAYSGKFHSRCIYQGKQDMCISRRLPCCAVADLFFWNQICSTAS